MIFVALSGAFSSRFPKSSPTKRTSFSNWRGFLENVQFNRSKLKKDKLAACWLRSRWILAWYWEYALCGTVRRNVLGVLLACCRAPSHPQRKRSLVYVEQGVVLPHFSGQSAKGATDIRPAGGPWRVVKVLGLTVASRDSKVCNCIKDLIATYFAGIIASITKQPK